MQKASVTGSLLLLQSLCLSWSGMAQTGSPLSFDPIHGHHMVLQRERPLRIGGRAAPHSDVTVVFRNASYRAVAAADGRWKVVLPPQPASDAPSRLTARSGTQEAALEDVLVGDVWICIGQSNMEWPLEKELHAGEEMASPPPRLLRFFNPDYAGKDMYGRPFTDSILRHMTRDSFYTGVWQACDNRSRAGMSAVAYHFGRQVSEKTGVPQGLVNLSIGGAPLEAFMDPEALRADEAFSRKLRGDWTMNDALPHWVRERGLQNVGGLASAPADSMGRFHAFRPGFAFEAGLSKWFATEVRGVLNYQGESNAQEAARVEEYGALSACLVKSLRKGWGDASLPYYFVQLSSIDTVKYKGQLWGRFRDGQRRTLDDIPFSGMAVCSDIGARDDVHPRDKRTVGERLARLALQGTYGLGITPCGPLPMGASYRHGKVVIRFRHADKGLKTADGRQARGFEADGSGVRLTTLRKDRAVLRVDRRPAHVAYGYTPFSTGNLVNGEGLPASTFRISVE